MPDTTFEPDTKMQKMAQSATLQVTARWMMVIFSGIGMPLIIAVVINTASTLSTLRDGLSDLKLSLSNTGFEVKNLKTLHEYQLRSFDDRLGAQSRRMDSLDQRFERLERPFFDGRQSGPTSPPR